MSHLNLSIFDGTAFDGNRNCLDQSCNINDRLLCNGSNELDHLLADDFIDTQDALDSSLALSQDQETLLSFGSRSVKSSSNPNDLVFSLR